MTGELAAVALVVIVATALAVSWHERRAPILGRRVLVNLTDGSALRGVLTRQRGPWLELRDAELFRVDTTVGGGPLRLDGGVFLERDRVSFFQVLP